MSKNRSTSHLLSKALSLGALFAALSTAALAQVVITDVTYTTTPTGGVNPVSTTLLNYSDYTSVAKTVTAGGTTYDLNAVSTGASVYVRRTTTIGSYPTVVAFQSNGNSSTYSSQYAKTGDLLSAGNSYSALLGAFTNGDSSNVERIDAYFGAATAIKADQGLSFFGLNVKAGDSFRIALITGWNGDAPTSFLNQTILIKVEDPSTYTALASPTGSHSTDYQAGVFLQTDQLAGSPSAVFTISAATLSGLLVRFSDFGVTDTMIDPITGKVIPSNTTILGYSVLAGDGTVNSGSDLLSSALYKTVYPDSTGVNGAAGGFDFAGFNTAIASPVPEPSTYGLLLTAGSLGFFAWRRRRLTVAQVKA